MLKLNQSWKRVGWLILNDLKRKRSILLLVFLGAFGYLSILFLNPSMSLSSMISDLFTTSSTIRGGSTTTITSYSNTVQSHVLKFHIEYFPAVLFIVGFIISSLSFREYGDIRSRRFHMTIPATLGEKWISKLIISGLIFPLFFLCIYQLFAMATYQWGAARGIEYVRLPIFDSYVWSSIGTFIALQCFVLMFGVYFRKYSFGKLLLSYIGLYFLSTLVLNLSLIIFFPDTGALEEPYNHNLFSWDNYFGLLNHNGSQLSASFKPIISYSDSTFWIGVSAIFALFMSYLRFKELEA